jgi:XTP/dITP diphosphohydrolase
MIKKKKKDSFQEFITIVKRLRKECPWDREQTHLSIRHTLIEETYEIIEAIEEKNFDELKKELGDLLLHIVLHSLMAEEKHKFTLNQVIQSITQKMIHRHPHVFGDASVENAHEVKRNWEHIKLAEGRKSILDGVPKKMPALLRAQRIQEKASKVGFDWTRKKDVWKKVEEEISELVVAEKSKNSAHIEEEFGDLLFAIVNYSRFIGVNPEFALNSSSHKFMKRFRYIEEELHQRGKQLGTVSLEEMDQIWNRKKNAK